GFRDEIDRRAEARSAGNTAIDARLVMALEPVVYERHTVDVAASRAAHVLLVVEEIERAGDVGDRKFVRAREGAAAGAPLLRRKSSAPRVVRENGLRHLAAHRLFDLETLLRRELLEELRQHTLDLDDGDRRDDVCADEGGLSVRSLGNVW